MENRSEVKLKNNDALDVLNWPGVSECFPQGNKYAAEYVSKNTYISV